LNISITQPISQLQQ